MSDLQVDQPIDGHAGGRPMNAVDDAKPVSRGSVLIVDDDPIVCALVRATLESDGFGVIEANDGVEGWERYEQHRPDLLLVDVVMPRMDGYELCRELRRRRDSAYVPIVVVTSTAFPK
jgi:CheY-like chemotaxis protein